MKERLIIIFVALIAGLFITSAGFLIYQSTKKSTTKEATKAISNHTPTPATNTNGIYIEIKEPIDESIATNRTVTIKGKTNPENTVIASTNLQDTTGKADTNGNFTLEIDIATGANVILTRSVAPNGESTEDSRTVTYSTEEF